MIICKKLKAIALFAVIISVLVIGAIIVVGDGEVTFVSIDPVTQSVYIGETFTINVSCFPGQPINAYELQLQFDPSYLEALYVYEGNIFKGYSTFFNPGVIDNNEGVITNIYGLILGVGNVSNQGSLVSVTFQAKSNVGFSTLSLFNVGVTNELGYISIEKQNGEITIYDTVSPHFILSINPANKSQNVVLSISELRVTIYDMESDAFDWMIYTSPNIGSNSSINSLNGTKTCSISGLAYSTTYNWYAHCKDLSTGEWTNESFWFRTVPSGGNEGNNGYIPQFSTNVGADENNPPVQPIKPVGSTSIDIGVVYSYSSSAIDDDKDLIRLKFDWGDGNQSDWSDYVSSNKTVEMNHYWDIISSYNIRVLAQDQQGENSTWSEPLEVIVSQINTTGVDISIDDIPYIVELLNISNITYSLIDLDNDGNIEVFYNQMKEFNSSFSYLDDNSILIDLEGDGSWDYIYYFEQKILSIYSSLSEDSKSEISIINLWFLILICLFILLVVIVLFRNNITLFILKLRLSIIQLESSFFCNNKRLPVKPFNSSLKQHDIFFFSNLKDKKQHINKNFKKIDKNKNLKTKLYRFKESKPFDESDYYDCYSRIAPHLASSLSKKIEDYNLVHDKILSKIDLIIGTYEEHSNKAGISNIERKVIV